MGWIFTDINYDGAFGWSPSGIDIALMRVNGVHSEMHQKELLNFWDAKSNKFIIRICAKFQ